MSGIRGVTLAVRFLLELTMLAVLWYWGIRTGQGPLGVVLGLGAPLAAATVWGVFVAPKAKRRLRPPRRLLLELALFGSSAVALGAAGQPVLAVVFGVLAAATCLANASQEGATRS